MLYKKLLIIIILSILFGCAVTEDVTKSGITEVDDVEDIPEELESPIMQEEIPVQTESSFVDPLKEVDETTNNEEQTSFDNFEYKPLFDWPISVAIPIEDDDVDFSESDSSKSDSFYKLLIRGACELAEATAVLLVCEKKFKLSLRKQLICMTLAATIPKYCPE